MATASASHLSAQQRLSKGLQQLQLPISDVDQLRLLAYIQMLQKWNRTYNLTAIKNLQDMVALHLLDSLSILPFVSGKRLLDVGSGAGLPGIPLALAKPELDVVLLDSQTKKVRFLRQAVHTLDLKNITVEQARIEEFKSEACFDTIVSRAFSSLRSFVEGADHVCCPQGQFLAMKGEYPETELREIENAYKVRDIHALEVPFIHAQRHVVLVNKG